MSSYAKWRKPRGGVKREDGTQRLCMHCGKDAVHAAIHLNDKFVLDVWFCDEHADRARGIDT